MVREIRPLTADDIPELSQFLTTGFHTLPDADYAAADVLRWKYLEPDEFDDLATKNLGLNAPRSFIARSETGAIIGHLGLCRTAFEGQSLIDHGGQIPTIHIIDWLGAPQHRAVGTSLMRKAHQDVPTQFGLGVSPAALVVGERIGYELRGLVPVYVRVLKTAFWIRSDESNLLSRGFRLIGAVTTKWVQPAVTSRSMMVLKRVPYFGHEIDPVVAQAKDHVILTRRDPTRLNTILRFPRQAMTGWHLLDPSGRLRGLAVLNIVSKDQGRTRIGKIVDCLLDDIAVDRWQTVIMALTQELARQGADLVQAYASTPWTAEALRQSGYKSRFAVKFHIRDRQALIPHEVNFHLTPLEGDYAYT